MKKKKINSYYKIGLVMLASAVGGGILGMLCFMILDERLDSIENGMIALLSQLQQTTLPLMILITLVSIIYGEMNLRRQKEICRGISKAEDEECDRLEYEEERNGARGTIVNILSQVLCILVLSSGYSVRYIADNNENGMLLICLVFLICFGYDGFWQVRFVKCIQTAHPEKKGDPASRKFYKEWLESCDEAEKELIYQSAYRAYLCVSRWIPILLAFSMIGHLLFNTGIMAIVMVAVIWLTVTISYLRSCVNLKGAKIRE